MRTAMSRLLYDARWLVPDARDGQTDFSQLFGCGLRCFTDAL